MGKGAKERGGLENNRHMCPDRSPTCTPPRKKQKTKNKTASDVCHLQMVLPLAQCPFPSHPPPPSARHFLHPLPLPPPPPCQVSARDAFVWFWFASTKQHRGWWLLCWGVWGWHLRTMGKIEGKGRNGGKSVTFGNENEKVGCKAQPQVDWEEKCRKMGGQ